MNRAAGTKLAQIHACKAMRDEAARAAQRALTLREAEGDVVGQIMTLSNLMTFQLYGTHPKDAYETGKGTCQPLLTRG